MAFIFVAIDELVHVCGQSDGDVIPFAPTSEVKFM